MPSALASPKQAVATAPRIERKTFYRPELDALRFFAFLGVFRYHFATAVTRYADLGAPRWLSIANSATYAGAFGVDLFFVLSAYLITELLLREKDSRGTLDIRAFYIRRILRIWPLYFFCVALGMLPVFNPAHGFDLRYVGAFLLLSGNWSVVAWGWPAHTIVSPLWTVSIEEQFYLLWPPMVRSLSKHRIAVAALFLLLFSTLMRVVMVSVHAAPNAVRCNTLARLDPIASGILAAVILRGRVPSLRNSVRMLMLLGAGIVLVLLAHYWNMAEPKMILWVPVVLGYPLVAASCTTILLATLGAQLRIPALLVYLGKISYGLYVYHALGMVLADKLLPTHIRLRQLIIREALALTITVALAALSYQLLETPFLRLKKRFELIRSRPV